jgi:LacI family transcriptional regulator
MSEKTQVSLRDLARISGVDISTVSRALKNHPRVAKATCQRVQNLARELGYQINPIVASLAAQLRMGKDKHFEGTLGYITSFHSRAVEDKYYYPHFQASADYAKKVGYKVESFWAKEPGISGKRLTQILLSRGIRGLLLAPLYYPHGHLSLDWSQFAVVTLGYKMLKPRLHFACGHHAEGITLALRKLHKAGYRRVGLAIAPNANLNSDNMYYSRFFQYQHEMQPLHKVPVYCENKVDRAYNESTFRGWFLKQRPDAIICVGNEVFQWLEKMKVKVPGEVSVVSLDVIDTTGFQAGIFEHKDLTCAAAIDLLTQELQYNRIGVPAVAKGILIQPTWQDGRSLGTRMSARSFKKR